MRTIHIVSPRGGYKHEAPEQCDPKHQKYKINYRNGHRSLYNKREYVQKSIYLLGGKNPKTTRIPVKYSYSLNSMN